MESVTLVGLTEKEVEALSPWLDRFKQYMKTDEYEKDKSDRNEHLRFFDEKVRSSAKLNEFSESDFDELISLLWASRFWTNKSYVAQKILKENGLERIRGALKSLLETDEPEKTYSLILRTIKGMGPAIITEILCSLHPERCGIWNSQARKALEKLGLDSHVNTKKYALSAKEYGKFNSLLMAIADVLKRNGLEQVDLFEADFFLYLVASYKDVGPKPPSKPEFDHDEVRDLIAQIGINLGFDTDTEVLLFAGSKVDVIWRANIANLGRVLYVFEVHKSGSIKSALLNLIKASHVSAVQKVVIVSDGEQLDRIKLESEGLSEDFRKNLRLWDVREVLKLGEHLEEVVKLVNELKLMD